MVLPLSLIDPDPTQPRKTFDAAKLEELAESIDTDGLVQPIAVRPAGARYFIICGERRYRAHKLLGRTQIEAKVLDVTPGQAFRIALIENVQRDSLLAVEEARAYERILADQGIAQAELARQLGLDRRRVSEKLTLLRLPSLVQDLLSTRADDFGERHALLLATAPEGADVVQLARRCADEGWSLLRLKAALERRSVEPEATFFQNLHLEMNRRGGFTLSVRARSRDEVARTIAELERTLESLRASFGASARADNESSRDQRGREALEA